MSDVPVEKKGMVSVSKTVASCHAEVEIRQCSFNNCD